MFLNGDIFILSLLLLLSLSFFIIMTSSHTEPPPEPPPEEFDPVVALEHETLDECLDEMELCDHATDVIIEKIYEISSLLTYPVQQGYSIIRDTSAAFAAGVSEIANGFDFELLKAFFKKPGPKKAPLQIAPDGGDESGKVA